QDSKEFLDEFRDDLFNSEVYVFTPKGEVKALRANATALDFAYSIHSEVGNHCVGAKVNGSIVPLTYQLKTGDRVEILTLSSASPSKDWLNFVHTPTARNKIRNYFSKSNRNEDIEAGKNLLTQQLKELKIDFDFKKNQNVLDAVTTQLSFVNSDDLFANIGSKKISAYHTAKRIERTIVAANKDEKISNQEFLYNSHLSLSSGKTVSSANRPNKTYSQNGIAVKGLDDALVYLAQCCNPIFGDEIVGFITRGKGVSVHRANCPNVSDLKQKNPGRQIDVSWAQHSIDSFKAKIYIEAVDRMNLLYDISQFLSRQGLNIVSCELYTNKDNTCDITVVIEVSDIERLEQILRELLTVDGVFSARRLTSN
ncbi:MAG: TGS domain-containing protein, partial [Coriobacteriales bacterium]|nr:TGS domain-containing protein [Coriobacteriales bacterium]